jgi:hypothetical protein
VLSTGGSPLAFVLVQSQLSRQNSWFRQLQLAVSLSVLFTESSLASRASAVSTFLSGLLITPSSFIALMASPSVLSTESPLAFVLVQSQLSRQNSWFR